MVMLQPLAVALRANGERNIMVQSRDIQSEDIIKCTNQLMGQLMRSSPESKSGPDSILGSQVSSFSHGVYEAGSRRYLLVYKLLTDVMVITMVPSGSCVLTAQRVNDAITKLLLIYFRAAGTVTTDRIFRKYPEIYCSLGAILRDNGQDHQQAFLEGEGIMSQLTTQTQAKVATMLGIGTAPKKARDASNRASERYFQQALAEGSRSKRTLVSVDEEAAQKTSTLLPPVILIEIDSAQKNRKRRLNVTEDAFTKAAPGGDDDIDALGGLSLPGFQVPNEILPNLLADPDGLLRAPKHSGTGEEDEHEDVEEVEPEVEAEIESVVESEESVVQDIPGLGETGDLTLVEKWHARFSGLKLQSSGTQGQLVCNRQNLTCLCKLEVPQLAAVIEAAETAQIDPDVVSLDEESLDALRLSIRQTDKKSKAGAHAFLRYRLPAAAIRPPFVACLQVNERRSPIKEGAVGPRGWDIFMRVVIKSAVDLPVPVIGGRLSIVLPPLSPPIKSSKPKANFAAAHRSVQFVVPSMNPGETFTAKLMLSGQSSPAGPNSYMTTAHLMLFGEPSAGTLTGIRLQQGNSCEELQSVPGHFICLINMQPVIRRVQ